MSKWKKRMVVALSVTVFGSLTVACSQGSNKPKANESSPPSSSSSSSATPTGPKYPASMTYWVGMDQDAAASLKSYSEMGIYKQLEKITGTKVQFMHPPAGDKDQFNLMMATGKLPDVIYYPWKDVSPDKAVKEGRILRLNDLIDKYAPNLSKVLKDRPDLKKQLTSDDGNIYVFPFIPEDQSSITSEGPFLRQDWLDKLGLKVPTTIDEWEKVLTAFRDGDPNGNGKKDEIPLGYAQSEVDYAYAFMGAYGVQASFYQDKGVVKYGPIQPGYKEFLTTMNRWYTNGLIDKDFLTSTTKIRDSKIMDDTMGATIGWAASQLGKDSQLKRQSDPNTKFKLVGAPFPSLKPGELAVSNLSPTPSWGGLGAAISTSAKNPEEIAAWLDYGYSKEGQLLYNFGIEGESYTMVNGKPKYTDTILKNPNKLSVTQALSLYTVESSSGPFQMTSEANLQWHNDPDQMDAMQTWAKTDRSKYLPIYTSTDEQTRLSAIMADVATYKTQMIAKFIMGQEPLSKFDDYVATLKKLKIDEAVQIYQTQYDRWMAKK